MLRHSCVETAFSILTSQLVSVTVRVENLCVIQLSEARQVAVNSSSFCAGHVGKQHGVRVHDAVIVYRSRPAACRFVCGGDHSLSHQYSSFVGAHGCEAYAKLSDRYCQYHLDKRRNSIRSGEYITVDTETTPIRISQTPANLRCTRMHKNSGVPFQRHRLSALNYSALPCFTLLRGYVPLHPQRLHPHRQDLEEPSPSAED